MDSQHRHELEQNDLLEFITHLREWWIKNGLKTLLLVLAVMVCLFLYVMQKQKAKDTHDSAWGDLSSASSPESLRGVAKAHIEPGIAVHAYLRAADLSLAKALGQGQFIEKEGELPALDDAQRKQLLDSAGEDYQHIVDNQSAHTAVKLNAMLGLASVAEFRHQWDQARELYDRVQQMAKDKYQVIELEAKARADALDRAAVPVMFAPPDPEPASDDTLQPDSPEAAAAPDTPEASDTPETPASEPAD